MYFRVTALIKVETLIHNTSVLTAIIHEDVMSEMRTMLQEVPFSSLHLQLIGAVNLPTLTITCAFQIHPEAIAGTIQVVSSTCAAIIARVRAICLASSTTPPRQSSVGNV